MQNRKYKFSVNGGLTWDKISANEIGHRVLSYDGYEYFVTPRQDRFGDDTKYWALYVSNRSKNHQFGNGGFYQVLTPDCEHENEYDAEAHILELVGLDFISGNFFKLMKPSIGDQVIVEENE